MSFNIKDTLEEFANHLCKGTLYVNVGKRFSVYFSQLSDGRIFVECTLWKENSTILVSFAYDTFINIVEAYKLYCQIFDISLHEEF